MMNGAISCMLPLSSLLPLESDTALHFSAEAAQVYIPFWLSAKVIHPFPK